MPPTEYRKLQDGRFPASPSEYPLAGGTTLLDLMKLDVERPSALLDLRDLPLREVRAEAGGLRVGALVSNTALAEHPLVRARFALLSQALLSGATQQIRNMASLGGNLLQRTRCPYFRDTMYTECNKRDPGSGCAALAGVNRTHAVLGVSDACIATHPSDMAVALTALGARLSLRGPHGRRELSLADFYLRPGDTPQREHALESGELIESAFLPDLPPGARSTYLKVRDRASYEFALASAAVALVTEDGVVRAARVALGGVGTVPWRSPEAEGALLNRPATRPTFEDAARAALAGARTREHNAYKPELARRTLVRALETLTESA